MNKKKYTYRYVFLVFSSLLLLTLPSLAGGYAVKAKIHSIKLNKNWSYTAKMTWVERKDRQGKKIPDETFVVHFYHTKEPYPISRQQFEQAVKVLKGHVSSGKAFDFGIMGSQGGMKKIKGKADEYKSINLNIYDGIVYTFGG